MKTEKKLHIDDSNYGYWRCPIHGTGEKCCKKSKWVEVSVLQENEKVKITLNWEDANRIAHYYQFPTTVFLLNSKELKKLKGTRREKFADAYEKLQKIREVLE